MQLHQRREHGAGNSSVLLPETSLPSSFTASSDDCSCTNAVRISSNCLAQQIQDQSMGDYDQICRQDDNTLVYVNIDGGMNLYYMEDNEKWLVSSEIGSPTSNLAICSKQNCPTD